MNSINEFLSISTDDIYRKYLLTNRNDVKNLEILTMFVISFDISLIINHKINFRDFYFIIRSKEIRFLQIE